ncbi:PQQ-binding-like beta-propeller repeat protein [Streptosporangium sp. NPDC048047]|uniref:outer membrane protein assembly factor BamB family protein n=1 Tax=Streptosporangium sp. NPDC048047 TaxID=3155748 RepID=UPI00343D1BCE
MLLVALGLVVLLGIGAGTAWFVSGGFGSGTGGLGDGEWRVPFTTEGTEVIGTDASIALGTWVSDKAAVRVQKDGLLAYDLGTGKRAWGIPSPGGEMCAATHGLSGGRGAAAHGTGKVCDRLVGVDAGTGRIAWKTAIPPMPPAKNDKGIFPPTLLLSGDLVVVRTWEEVAAYRLSDGGRAWRRAISSPCAARDALASAAQVAVSLSCTEGGDAIVVLDARTGAVAGRQRVAGIHEGPEHLLSADPVVAAWDGAGEASILVLEDRGRKARRFGTGEEVDLLRLNRAMYLEHGREELRAAVRGGTLYLAAAPVRGKSLAESRNDVLAFDLATGRRLWKSSGIGQNRITFVEGDAGEKGLLVLEVGGYSGPAARLTRIDTATGRATPVAELPDGVEKEGEDAHVHHRDGTLVVMPFQQPGVRYAVTTLRAGGRHGMSGGG